MAESPPPQHSSAMHQQSNYVRQSSTESGVDNPFRPDGDLSREADELLELLKGSGRPISEVLKSRESTVQLGSPDAPAAATLADDVHESPDDNVSASSPLLAADDITDGAGKANGTVSPEVTEKSPASVVSSPTSAAKAPAVVASAAATKAAGSVEVQHAVVAPVASESQVEHVVIKKKSKCQCCVLQ